MAQIRVKQIKDLSLVDGVIKIGDDTIIPLTTLAGGGTQEGSVISGITVSGNTITPSYTKISDILNGYATQAWVTEQLSNYYTKGEIDTTLADYSTTEEMGEAISTAIEGLTGSATIATNAGGVVTLKAGIVETNGKISNSTGADITLTKLATTGAAADVSIADAGGLYTTENVEAALAEVMTKVNAIDAAAISVQGSEAIKVTNGQDDATVKTVSLKIAQADQVLTQSTDGLKANVTLTYGDVTEGERTYKAIQLVGKDNANLGTIDATNFIKDGMLSEATIVRGSLVDGTFTPAEDGAHYIKLVWNTDAGKDEMYVPAETLVDSYESGNAWIEIDQVTNEISHLEQNVDTGVHGSRTDNLNFTIPTVQVDKAGHVTNINEEAIAIPTATTIASENGAGLATEGAVKTYVDSTLKAQATKHVHVESTSTTIDLKQSRYTLVSTDNYNYDVYQNGIRLSDSEFSIEDTTMTIVPEVTHVPGDKYLVCYVVEATELPL